MSRYADDPYLEWTRRTNFDGHAAMQGPAATNQVPVLLQADAAQRLALETSGLAAIAAAWPRGHKYFTATVARHNLLDVQDLVSRLEFSLPLPPGPGGGKVPRRPRLGNRDVVFAAIDRGCAFLNAAFCRPVGGLMPAGRRRRRTRLIAVWDQGHAAAAGLPWTTPGDFGYGRELDRAAIDLQLARLVGPAPETEARVYRGLDYIHDDVHKNGTPQLRESAHGTHVLDTGAGCIGRRPPRSSAKPPTPDAASSVPLIFVDAPGLAQGDTTGAASGAYLLDALRYIRLRAGPRAHVVVNVSLGAFAGPHDGTSMVEEAIDDFVARDPAMYITIAAGNAALERWHARGRLMPSQEAELRWRTMPQDSTDSFVEIWSDDGRRALEVRLTPPTGPPTPWLALGDSLELRDGGGAVVAALIARARPSGMMALLAVGPAVGTRRGGAAGQWRIGLRNSHSGPPVAFDAWIQRDEPAWGAGVSVQSYFESASGAEIGGASALSSLATGQNTIVVGAANVETGREASYSSRGGTPRGAASLRDVDVVAPADESDSEIGLLAAGVRSFTEVRMGGTSVAAPVVARKVVNHLVKRTGAKLPRPRVPSAPAPPAVPAAKGHPPAPTASASRTMRAILRRLPKSPSRRFGPAPVALVWPG